MYKIGTLNKISPVGLARLTDDYTVVEDVAEANGIILRSYDMHEMELSDNLLAVGRAGAGVNNIPLDKCAEQGIVVFNAPGANANAVKELCLTGMLLAARNVPAGLAWASTLTGTEAVSYTHLDVYKRQLYHYARGFAIRKYVQTFSAVRAFIPGAASSSYRLACLIRSTLLKCSSRAFLRTGPIPSISSRTDPEACLFRKVLWYSMANRCTSSCILPM